MEEVESRRSEEGYLKSIPMLFPCMLTIMERGVQPLNLEKTPAIQKARLESDDEQVRGCLIKFGKKGRSIWQAGHQSYSIPRTTTRS